MNLTKINIGPGLTNIPGWLNLDLAGQTAEYRAKQPPFIKYDIMEIGEMPIETDFADIIYCSHVLEHVTNRAGLKLMLECKRALKDGGMLRISVPDADLIYEAYCRSDIGFFQGLKTLGEPNTVQQWVLDQVASKFCVGNPGSAITISDSDVDMLFHCHGKYGAMEILRKKCEFDYLYCGNHINYYFWNKLAYFLEISGFRRIRRSGFLQSSVNELRNAEYFDFHPTLSLFVEAFV